jgi:hypothetical protein
VIEPAGRVTARLDRRSWVGIGGILVAAGVGVAVVAGPIGMAVAALALGAAALVLAGPRIPAVFAYVGVGVAYVGEVAVALAMVATIVSLGRWRIGVTEGLLLAFMGWGAIRTIPYLGQYGPLALRDAVTWAYALVGIGVAATLTPRVLLAGVGLYRRIALPAAIWFPIAAVLTIVLGDSIPTAPGSPVPLVYFKAGDTGVHLAGIAAFALVGLYGRGALQEAVLWVAWSASALLSAALNRGGMVAASTAVFALLFVRRLNHWLVLIAVGVVLLVGRPPCGSRRAANGLVPAACRQRDEHLRRSAEHDRAGDKGMATRVVGDHHGLHGEWQLLLDRQGLRHQPGRFGRIPGVRGSIPSGAA